MPDKKINELPDESGMTTADTDKLIFIGDPADGKLFKGIKPVGGGGGGGITTANNGLSANTSTNVQLGGTLLANTAINGNGNALIINGNNSITALQASNSSDGYAIAASGNDGYGIYCTSGTQAALYAS